MSEEELKKALQQSKEKLSDAGKTLEAERKRLKPFEERVNYWHNRSRKIEDALYDLHQDDIEYLLRPSEDVVYGSNSKHKHLNNILASRYGNVVRRDGCSPDTLQEVIQLRFNWTKDKIEVPVALKAIRDLTPYIIKRNEDGLVFFDIFVHTLTRWEKYSFRVKSDLTRAYLKNHRGRIICEGDLEEVLTYIHDNHWYTGKEEDDYN